MWTRNFWHRHSCLLQSTRWKNQVLLDKPIVPAWPSTSERLFLSSASERANQLKKICVKKYDNFYKNYEEFVGLTDVQNAQFEVRSAEKDFLEARGKERLIMRDMVNIRNELKHVRERLSHVNYSNPLYPQLASEQHELVTREEKIKDELDLAEEKERDSFLVLSAAMRDSYEKERARVERTKNWSLIGSVIGTIIGFVGSSYINQVRTSELKQMVLDKHDNAELKEDIDKVIPFVNETYTDIKEELTQLEAVLVNRLIELPQDTDNKQSMSSSGANPMLNKVHQEMKEIKALISKIDAGVANFKDLQTDTRQEISKIKESMTSRISAGTVQNFENASQFNDNVDDGATNVVPKPSKRTFYDIVVWGSVMSALYYVLTV